MRVDTTVLKHPTVTPLVNVDALCPPTPQLTELDCGIVLLALFGDLMMHPTPFVCNPGDRVSVVDYSNYYPIKKSGKKKVKK